MASLDQARSELRARLGAGARWDSPAAPAETLGWARTGTAYFARLLNDLPDAALDAPSLVPGWSRRHIVAQVGYQARALTRLTEWAASGVPTPMYESEAARLADVEDGATLPSRALRGLFRHAAVHLDVEWRDLEAEAWDAALALPEGGTVTARDTAWMRAREVWLRAVDLGSGGSFLDMPPALVDWLIEDARASWAGPALTAELTDRSAALCFGGIGGTAVSGRAADVARWLTGRGARRLMHAHPLPPVPPPAR